MTSTKKTSYSIIIFLFIIINLPKINLITFGGYGLVDYSQGIRFDDVLILIFVLLKLKDISFSRESILIFVYISFAYVLSFFHQIDTANFLFIQFHYIKFVQYFLLYSVLIKTISREEIILVVFYTFVFQIIYGSYSFFTLPFQEEFTKDSRAKGTTAGPWELSSVAVMSYFIIEDHLKRQKKLVTVFFAYSLLWYIVLITYSRISLIALVIVLAFKNIKFSLIISFIIVLVILIFPELDFFENINLGYFSLTKVYNFLKDFGVPIINNFSEGNFFLGRGGNFYDASSQNYSPSLVSRLQQWGRYLNTFNNSEMTYVAYIFGNGPGSGGIINDGMYIKLFVDFGIIGTLIYIYLIIKKFILNKSVRHIIIYISIVCITLDFYWPTKIAYTFILLMIYFNRTITKIETKN